MTTSELLVVDASVVVAWGLGEEVHAKQAELLQAFFLAGGGALAPNIFPIEVVGALVVAEREGRIKAEETDRFLANLWTLPIELDDAAARAPEDVLAVARRHKLKAQDACYLELCLRKDLRLVTVDGPLLRAAKLTGAAYP